MATYAEEVVRALAEIGCDKAFGVSGGYILASWKALDRSAIQVYHCRHETGAVFAAMEHSLHTDKIAVTFVTSGPGISNAITGLKAAREDGARIVLISSLTTEGAGDGKRIIHEMTPSDAERMAGTRINNPLSRCIIIKKPGDLERFRKHLSELADDPLGGVLGVFYTPRVQNTVVPLAEPGSGSGLKSCSKLLQVSNNMTCLPKEKETSNAKRYAAYLTERLRNKKFFLWVGYGSRRSAGLVRWLAEQFKTPVICTPRAKGIFPETHPLYWGVSGMGTTLKNTSFPDDFSHYGALVLGTRLAEFSSFHIQEDWTDREIVCVDLEASEIRRNMPPNAIVLEADIDDLLRHMAGRVGVDNDNILSTLHEFSKPLPNLWEEASQLNLIHPASVMAVVQEVAINRYNCSVIADAGNSFCWSSHHLKFVRPNQYRLSVSVSAMGHGSCGAVGIGLSGSPVVAIVGDGAMLKWTLHSTRGLLAARVLPRGRQSNCIGFWTMPWQKEDQLSWM